MEFGGYLSKEAIDRIFDVVRKFESDRSAKSGQLGLQPGPRPVRLPMGSVHVIITGPRRIINTVAPVPTGSTSSTTSSTTTSSAPVINPPSTTSTTTTTAGRSAYTGFFLYQNNAPKQGEQEWVQGETCYVQEINNRSLGIGCKYHGNVVGMTLDLQAIVIVDVGPGQTGQTMPANCGSGTTTTTTTSTCGGHCEFELNLETGLWGETLNQCAPNCNCPWPDFCPPGEECGKTETQCFPGLVRPEAPAVLCTTTTTGTGTTSTTVSATTTPTTTTEFDPEGCGTGCIWKLIGDVGSILTQFDCTAAEFVLSDGTVCRCTGQCGLPMGEPGFCNEVFAPCAVVCTPPPPPPFCRGQCKWIWPAVPGMWWQRVQQNSFHCLSNVVGCLCFAPDEPGNVCMQEAVTPCFIPVPPTTPSTSGTGTTLPTSETSATSATTSTTLDNCRGFCYWRWSDELPGWEVTSGCGESCGCSDPTFEGDDECDVAKTPCQTTTTTSGSTTSTSSTTTTTTTTNLCAPYNCRWLCRDPGSGYAWELDDECPLGCGCESPRKVCNEDMNRGTQNMPCGQTCDCSSPGPNGKCCWQCAEFGAFGLYGWEQVCASCSPGNICYLSPFAPLCSPGNVGDVHYGVCQGSPPTTSSTTNTTSTSVECLGDSCIWRCFGPDGWGLLASCHEAGCACYFPPGIGGPCSPEGEIINTGCFDSSINPDPGAG